MSVNTLVNKYHYYFAKYLFNEIKKDRSLQVAYNNIK